MNSPFTPLRHAMAAVAGCGLLLGLASSAAAQSGQFLQHHASELCVDVAGAPGTANGAKLSLWSCEANGMNAANSSATDQKWTYSNGFIRNGLSGKCVDVPGNPGTARGSRLQIWDCEASGRSATGAATDQQFDRVNDQFRHRLSGLCIGPDRTDNYRNGVPLVLVPCAKPGAADLEFIFANQIARGQPQAAAPKAMPAPAAATGSVATSSKPQYIYPDWPGASQSCVVPIDPETKRYAVKPLAELMLSNCTPAQGLIFNVTPQRISIAGKPNLCVNISAGARQAVLYLEECRDTEVKGWESKGVDKDSGRLRAVGGLWDNQCLAIPELANPNAKFPLRVNAVACAGGGRDLKFFVATN